MDRPRFGTKHNCLWGNTPKVGAEMQASSRDDPASYERPGSFREGQMVLPSLAYWFTGLWGCPALLAFLSEPLPSLS